jgi:hypothetical protein
VRHERPHTSFRATALCCALLALIAAGCGSLPRTSIILGSDTIGAPSLNAVDHNLLTSTLSRAVDDAGNIDIEKLKGDASLTSYLEQLAIARTDVFPSRHAQLTFWINAYNAYVLDMLRLNPIKNSPNDISRLKSAPIVIVAGKRNSLADIETNLIKQFREPRMFFALVTGERGGGQFWKEAYLEEKLSDQLDRAVKSYFADTANTRLDKEKNMIFLSSFVQAHQEHFITAAGSVVGFIRAFAPPAIAEHIDQRPTVKVSYTKFNDALRRAR